MTTRNNLVRQSNKVYLESDRLLESDVIELKDQIDCLQRSVATLRKDIPSILIQKLLDIENRRALYS